MSMPYREDCDACAERRRADAAKARTLRKPWHAKAMNRGLVAVGGVVVVGYAIGVLFDEAPKAFLQNHTGVVVVTTILIVLTAIGLAIYGAEQLTAGKDQ